MASGPERNHEAYNESGLFNLGWTSLDNIITINMGLWWLTLAADTHTQMHTQVGCDARTRVKLINLIIHLVPYWS